MPQPKRKLTPKQQIEVDANKAADWWWGAEGRYLDPDTEDVDWFDKRDGLAKMAYIAGYKKAAENA